MLFWFGFHNPELHSLLEPFYFYFSFLRSSANQRFLCFAKETNLQQSVLCLATSFLCEVELLPNKKQRLPSTTID